MNAEIAYGRQHLNLALPQGARILRTAPVQPLAHPAQAVADALHTPIGTPPLPQIAAARRAVPSLPASGKLETAFQAAAGRRHACIVVSDITRPVPYRVLLPPLLAALDGVVGRITLLVATGTHRASTQAEKLEMFGPDIVARYPIVDHDSRDPAQVAPLPAPTASGSQVSVNRLYLDADLKILTGLVEPHFMAGYSGGRKAVLPGLVDLASIQRFHGPGFLESPRATSGVLDGNPCHREATDAAHAAGCDFVLNVALDLDRNIIGVFAGGLDTAFAAAVAKVDSFCRATVAEPADIVVTSAGGYPLDKTFYQTVKGMVGALPVVRQGGVVLIASACSEGIGNAEYAELMARYHGRHEQFLRDILARDEVVQDQWEFEEQCKVLARVGVGGLVVCTNGIPRDTLDRLSVTPAATLCQAPDPEQRLQGALDALLAARPGARVVAIPEGPYVLAGVNA